MTGLGGPVEGGRRIARAECRGRRRVREVHGEKEVQFAYAHAQAVHWHYATKNIS